MSQFTPIAPQKTHLKPLILIVVLVIVILLVIGVWWFMNKNTNTPVNTTDTNTGVVTNASTMSIASFKTLAGQAGCAQIRNDLYLIDSKMVVWLRQGNCPDNGYTYTLYARNPQEPLCVSRDSMAGPNTSCVDDSYVELFDTIIGNLDDARLGLDSGHRVEPISL